jgi:hypothetical protein
MDAKELKIKDVMCGDWVDVRNDASPNTPHIEKITPSHLLRNEHWYGIELTPEVLEKNGFNVDKYSDGDYYAYIMFEDQGRRVEVEYKYGVDIDVCAIGRNNTPPFSRIETQVRYIHELQHIFRIMQINIEIVF